MSKELQAVIPSAVPSYLQSFRSGMGDAFLGGAEGKNKISLKGGRFRFIVNGKEEAIWDHTYLDVIVVGIAYNGVKTSRKYFEGVYDPTKKIRPTCYSPDGVTPGDDSQNKQATKCSLCPKNEVGSAISPNGKKARACKYFSRFAVVIEGEKENRVFQLDNNSLSLWADDKASDMKFNFKNYNTFLKNRGIDPMQVVTRLSFDTDSSVPKLLFSFKDYVSKENITTINDIVHGSEVKEALKVSGGTIGEESPENQNATSPVGEVETTAKPANVDDSFLNDLDKALSEFDG